MDPLIKDGDCCVFEFRNGTCDDNDIVLAEYSEEVGGETMGAYAIKKFVGKKRANGTYISARLVPENDDYDDIKIVNKGREVRNYRIVGVWRSRIKVRRNEGLS